MDFISMLDTMSLSMDSRLEFLLTSVDFLLMNHLLGPNTPLLRLHVPTCTLHLENIINARLSVTVSLALLAHSFNARNQHWEPLLEPWHLSANVLHKTAAALRHTVRDGDYLSLQARCSPFSINLTEAFVDSLVTSLTSRHRDAPPVVPRDTARPLGSRRFAKGASDAPATSELRRESMDAGDFLRSPYWIRNDSGCVLSYTLVADAHRRKQNVAQAAASDGAVIDPVDRESRAVDAGEQTPIRLGSAKEQREREILHRASLRLSVHLHGDAFEVSGVTFDSVGTRVYGLHAVALANGGGGTLGGGLSQNASWSETSPWAPNLVCEVRARDDGSNVLIVRSPLQLRNATEVGLEVRLHALPDAGVRAKPRQTVRASYHAFQVRPGETCAVPLDVFHHIRGGVSIRPCSTGHLWSRCAMLNELADGGSYFRCEQGRTKEDGPPAVDAEDGATTGTGAADITAVAQLRYYFCNAEAERDGHWDGATPTAAPVAALLDREVCQAGQPTTIAFFAPFVLQNLLAVDTQYTIRSKAPELRRMQQSGRLERGARCSLYGLDPSRAVALSVEVDGYSPSSSVTLKPSVRDRSESRLLAKTLQRLQSLGRYVPEIGSFGTQGKMVMTDRARRPLTVLVDSWDGVGSSYNMALYCTYWLVNKSSLPLTFRRSAPLRRGRLRPVAAMDEEAGAVTNTTEDFDDAFALLDDHGQRGMRATAASQPNVLSSFPLEYDPLEVTAGPLMVSYAKTTSTWEWPFFFRASASLQVAGDTGWSSAFQLDQPTSLSIDSKSAPGSYELGVECRFAPPPFHRTRLVFFCNRHVLSNDTNHSIQYMQVGTSPSTEQLATQTIAAGSSHVFHWHSRHQPKQLTIRVLRPSDGSMWSSPFRLTGDDTSGESFVLKVRRPASRNVEHLDVSLQPVAPVVFAVFATGQKETAPVMLRNELREEVRLQQKGCHYFDALPPRQTMPYVWDLPHERRLVLVLTFRASEANSKSSVRRELHVDGRSQLVEIKLPAGTHAGSVVPGAALPGTMLTSRVVQVRVQPIDCQRCLITFAEASSRHSLLIDSISRSVSSLSSLTANCHRASLSRSSASSSVHSSRRSGDLELAGRHTGAGCAGGSTMTLASAAGSASGAMYGSGGRLSGAGRVVPFGNGRENDGPRAPSQQEPPSPASKHTPPSPARKQPVGASIESRASAGGQESLCCTPPPASRGIASPPAQPRAALTAPASDSCARQRRRVTLSAAFSDSRPQAGSPDDAGARSQSIALKRRSLLRSRVATPIVTVHSPNDPNGAQRRSARHSTQAFSATQAGRLRELRLLRSVMADDGTVSASQSGENMWEDSGEAVVRRQFAIHFECEALQVSVVDDCPQELLFLSVGGLSFSAVEGPPEADPLATSVGNGSGATDSTAPALPRIEQRLRLELRTLQVDNQRYSTAFPVTLASIGTDSDGDDSGEDVACALRVVATRDVSFSRRRFAYVRLLQIQCCPLSLMIDEESARAFGAFFDVFDGVDGSSARDRARDRRDGMPQPNTLFERSMLVPTHRATRVKGLADPSARVFIEALDVSGIGLRASVKRAPSGSQGLSLNPFFALFNLFTTALISIDDAPIHFKSMRRAGLFISPVELGALSAKHYRTELWRAVLMVALSLDCIGKPYESFTDLVGALHALLVRPALTLIRKPSRFPRVLLGGLVELLKALLLVVFNSVSKLLRAWAKGVAVLTLDSEFSQRRLQRIEFRPALNAVQGLTQGLVCLRCSLWSALCGMFLQTALGFGRSGIRGVLAGVLRALLGLAVKPAVGVLDLVAKVFEGIKNTVSVLTVMQRLRPPRVFREDRVLRPFSLSEAQAQAMLGQCRQLQDEGASAARYRHEFYIAHYSVPWMTRQKAPGPPRLLLITSARVVLGDEARLRPLWEVPLERIMRVELKPDHVILWTWEQFGILPTSTYTYNIVVERRIFCSSGLVLEAMASKLRALATQQDRALSGDGRAGGAGRLVV